LVQLSRGNMPNDLSTGPINKIHFNPAGLFVNDELGVGVIGIWFGWELMTHIQLTCNSSVIENRQSAKTAGKDFK